MRRPLLDSGGFLSCGEFYTIVGSLLRSLATLRPLSTIPRALGNLCHYFVIIRHSDSQHGYETETWHID